MGFDSSKSFWGRADFGPDDHLTDVHLARVLGMSPGTLRNLRSQGGGPVFTKIGRSVRYRWSDVASWLDQRRTASTCGQGEGPNHAR